MPQLGKMGCPHVPAHNHDAVTLGALRRVFCWCRDPSRGHRATRVPQAHVRVSLDSASPSVLRCVTMAIPNTSIRLPPELLDRVDRYAAHLSETAGVPVSRAAAMAKL